MKGCTDMPDNIILERFKKFKAMIVSTNISNNLLLEMLENYITSNDDDNPTTEQIPVLDGQLSLLDNGFCA